jgi:predicted O-methyltransferase YrrM
MNSKLKKEILSRLKLEDPFLNYKGNSSEEMHGWRNKIAEFQHAFSLLSDTKVMLEIGSWYGQSACQISKILEKDFPDSVLLCIDTFLGGTSHWIDPELKPYLKLQHGMPTFYHSFLNNVINQGSPEHVVPLCVTSTVAATILKESEVTLDFLFVDGSHLAEDVCSDLWNYVPLMNENGIIMMDDWDWGTVRDGYKQYCDRDSAQASKTELIFETDYHSLLRVTK